MIIVYSPRCLDYEAPGHPESPDRIRLAKTALQFRHHDWLEPDLCTEDDILRVHSSKLLNAVKTGKIDDFDTPYLPNTYELARLSAGAAILAAEQCLTHEVALSLMRPPGHHAETNRVMGFCYFNNIAIAVSKLFRHPIYNFQKIGILDFDCHHGNGTEEIFTGNNRVLFASIHQSPCYPGTGLASHDNCRDYPLPPHTGPQEFLAALDAALAELRTFDPQVLAVSAGFDSFKHDPITQMDLEIDTFQEVGLRIADFCRQGAGRGKVLPCFLVLEGGYSADFGRCVESFVNAWW